MHLIELGQERENTAVNHVVRLAPAMLGLWLGSLNVHPFRHWCILRPELRGVHPKYESIEVDMVFGNFGESGQPMFTELAAVEAKCWVGTSDDLNPWAEGPAPKSNLWDQVRRNREAGFSIVGGLDIVCTEPRGDFWQATDNAFTMGKAKMGPLKASATKDPGAAYAILSMGAVEWKPESDAGSLGVLEQRAATYSGPTSVRLQDAIRDIFAAGPRIDRIPCHLVRQGDWRFLQIQD